MYITNNPKVATIAESCGVDRVWIDLERIGKEERQFGMNTVKSNHAISDVAKLRPYLKKAQMVVRINPLHERSKEEIDAVIAGGTDLIMLPMFKTVYDVKRFIESVNNRAKVILLAETSESIEHLKEIVQVPGIDEIHIGLNDLHLSYGLKFMFELLVNGTVESACNIIHSAGIPYGFGGVGKLGEGMLPAEYILGEHYRLGSSMVILSRTFCNVENNIKEAQLKEIFSSGIKKLRNYENMLVHQDEKYFDNNHKKVQEYVNLIVQSISNKRG